MYVHIKNEISSLRLSEVRAQAGRHTQTHKQMRLNALSRCKHVYLQSLFLLEQFFLQEF